jgi:hypothetical protein
MPSTQLPALNEITPEILAGLRPADDAMHLVQIDAWSVEAAAAAAASLANTDGGLIIVTEAKDLSEADLLRVGPAMETFGPRLIQARIIDGADGPTGLIAVRESGDPPVMATGGIIQRRTTDGPLPVSSRAELDLLIRKGQRLGARTQSVIDSQTERTAFGHLNFLTIALITTPVVLGSSSFAWAHGNASKLVRSRLGLAAGLTKDAVGDGTGVFELRLRGDETGFITVAKNGTITAGLDRMRPAMDRFVSAAELAAVLRDVAQVTRLLVSGGDAGLVQPAVFVQGMRNLRLEGIGGFGKPATKDQQRTLLRPQFVETDDDEEALAGEMLDVLSTLFSADLATGTVEVFEGAVSADKAPKAWHGKTRRTERRVAFQRRHGS